MIQQGGPRSAMSSEQGLSPPYSNQSPPYSVQSNMALSPHGYISKKILSRNEDYAGYFMINAYFRLSISIKNIISSSNTEFATRDA